MITKALFKTSIAVQIYKKVEDLNSSEEIKARINMRFQKNTGDCANLSSHSPRTEFNMCVSSEVNKSDPDGPGVEFRPFILFEHLVDRIGSKQVNKAPAYSDGCIKLKGLHVEIIKVLGF